MNQRSIAITIACGIASAWAVFLIWLQVPTVIASLVILSSISGGILLVFNVLRKSVNQPSFEAGVLPITIALTLFIPIILSIYGSVVKARGSTERVPVVAETEENSPPPPPPKREVINPPARFAEEIISFEGGKAERMGNSFILQGLRGGNDQEAGERGFAGVHIPDHTFQVVVNRQYDGTEATTYLASGHDVFRPLPGDSLRKLVENGGEINYGFNMKNGESRYFFAGLNPTPYYIQAFGKAEVHRVGVTYQALYEKGRYGPGKEVNFAWWKVAVGSANPTLVNITDKSFRQVFVAVLPDKNEAVNQAILIQGSSEKTDDGLSWGGVAYAIGSADQEDLTFSDLGFGKAFKKPKELQGKQLRLQLSMASNAKLVRHLIVGVVWDK